MELEIINFQGEKTGKQASLPDEIFGLEPNNHTIYLAVKQYLAAQRTGTHKVKTRAEVHGASRKLHKQKGTGGSRKGNIRNPLYKGGGTVFGPKPRSYNFKLNKKVKDLARISALSYKAKDNAIMVLEEIQIDTPKTKQFQEFLINTKLLTKKVLLVLDVPNEIIHLSTRNIPNLDTISLSDINTYELMNAEIVIFSENAVKTINGHDIENETIK